MNTPIGIPILHDMSLPFKPQPILTLAAATTNECGVKRRRSALRSVDRQLAKGNLKLAVSLVRQLQRQPPPVGLRGFASAKQIPRRISSVEELHLNVTETSDLQSLFDSILDSIKRSLQSYPLEEKSIPHEDADLDLEDDIIEHKQVLQHEAGHLLVGYLLGVLPKQYNFSSIEDVNRDKIFNANVKFVGFEFLTEVNQPKLSSRVLGKFACVIVGGLVAEHLVYGYSKGHHADVETLDRVLKWLRFSEEEAHTLIRWAVLNTLLILRHHGKVRSALVEAMEHGRSIGNCIDVIESSLDHHYI